MNKKIKIDSRIIGRGTPCFIIAEAGVNHNGDMKLAKKLIDEAKKSGADAIKFQVFKTEKLVSKNTALASYQRENTKTRSQYDMLKKYELSESQFRQLFQYCIKKKIIFLASAFDSESAKFLDGMNIKAFKIGSGELTDFQFLELVAKFKKPIIMSTGMSTLDEVKEAVEVIYAVNNQKLILMHCTSNYPADYRDVNLRALITLEKQFDLPIGYSDHTEGTEIAVAAVALGSALIEKHFTLSRKMRGPDHKTSIEPKAFKAMVQAVRNVEKSLGSGQKRPAFREKHIMGLVRKSLVSNIDIPKGMALKKSMITIKRPGTGIEPKYYNEVLGRKVKKFVKKDTVLTWGLLV